MSFSWILFCLGMVVLTNGAPSREEPNDLYKLYYPPSSQTLRDAYSPVLLATFDAKSFNGVKYTTAPGYSGAPAVKVEKKIPLATRISEAVKPYSEYGLSYGINYSKGKVIFRADGTYEVNHLSGERPTLNEVEMVEYYYHSNLEKKPPTLPTPSTLYPEILVVVHKDLFDSLGANIKKTVEYVTEFWAKVDMRFRGLTKPKVRLNIAGIVIAKDDRATPYITKPINDFMWSSSLKATKKYMHYQPYLKNFYDVVVVMVKSFATYDSENSNTEGMATLNATCKPQIGLDSIYLSPVALINDDGLYEGVNTAAHELGHVFGSEHDIPEVGCTIPEGIEYIMTPTSTSINETIAHNEFSACSKNFMLKNLNSEKVACYYNKPNIRKSPPQTLKKLTLNDVCKNKMGEKAYAVSKNICSKSLWCHPGTGRFTYSILGMLNDGIICAKDKVCMKGRCMNEPALN